MPAVMRASAAVEKAGVPAVAVGSTEFERMGRTLAGFLGIPHVPLVIYPGTILTDTSQTFGEKMREVVAPALVDALVGRAATAIEADADRGTPGAEQGYEPGRIVFSGCLDAVQDEVYRRGWSDGMPVVPPTVNRIKNFLSWTERNPDEVLGVALPERREATIWSVAANGVMAGCRPEYMPLLISLTECMLDPLFRMEDAGSTPGWEPLVVVSGPLARDLKFNWGTGVLRVGRQANTTVGRFVRMVMRNLGGLRPPPWSTDQGAISYTFNVALAEDDEHVRQIGWSSYRAELGASEDETVVSLRSVVAISAPIYSGGDIADDHLRTICELFKNAIGPWAFTGIAHQAWYPLLVIGPSVAEALNGFGIGKTEIRQYLYEHAMMPAGELERYARQVGRTTFSVRDGEAIDGGKAIYAASDDPARQVPMFVRPEWIGIVVAGNPGRNQSRAYVGNHTQGSPVYRVVRTPGNFSERLAEQRKAGMDIGF